MNFLRKLAVVCVALLISGAVWANCGKDSCGANDKKDCPKASAKCDGEKKTDCEKKCPKSQSAGTTESQSKETPAK